MPSVSLAMSVSELQSESDAISITTVSCSSPTAISFNQHARSTDKTCWTHFKIVQLDPLCSMLFRYLLFYIVSLHQPFNGTIADPVIVEVVSFAWFSDIFSPSSFSCLQKNVIYYIWTRLYEAQLNLIMD